jgi:hypothetical protein
MRRIRTFYSYTAQLVRLAIVMAASVAGAAVFAATHPAPRDAYEAAGAIVIPSKDGAISERVSLTRQAAELLRQPGVVSEALDRASQGSEPGSVLQRLDVKSRPEAGIVGFSVRASTRVTARTLAESLGRVVVQVIQLGQSSGELFGLRIVGDFEVGTDGWGATGPENGLGAVGIVSHGRYGGNALRVRCEVAAGCGASRVMRGQFRAGRVVTTSIWLRGRRTSSVLIVLGSASTREHADERAKVGRRWRRFVVRWTPIRNESRIAIQVVNAGPRSSDVELDGALLFTERGVLTQARERTLFAERRHAYVAPVRIVASRTGRTLTWALIGACAGLLIGLAAVSAWTFALRRHKKLRDWGRGAG